MPYRKLALGGACVAILVLVFSMMLANSMYHTAVMNQDPQWLLTQSVWSGHVRDDGGSLFRTHCASCHGNDSRGNAAIGAANLTDSDYLYGNGDVLETEQIVLHGIRSGNLRGWNLASMPAYGTEKPYSLYAVEPLSPGEIDKLASYLQDLGRLGGASGQEPDQSMSATLIEGSKLYASKGCWDCHGADARGDTAIGAPNLRDHIWLYGDGSRQSIAHSLTFGRHGQMPAFEKTLSPVQARTVAIYAWSLSHKAGAREK